MTSGTTEQFRLAMRRAASSVYVVATQHGALRAGMTASAVASVSFEPLSMLICVHRTASCHDLLLAAEHFSLSLLAPEQTDVATIFSQTATEEKRFSTGHWTSLDGVPVLEGAAAVITLKTTSTTDAGTHTVFFGDVQSVRLGAREEALQYGQGHFGRFVP